MCCLVPPRVLQMTILCEIKKGKRNYLVEIYPFNLLRVKLNPNHAHKAKFCTSFMLPSNCLASIASFFSVGVPPGSQVVVFILLPRFVIVQGSYGSLKP